VTVTVLKSIPPLVTVTKGGGSISGDAIFPRDFLTIFQFAKCRKRTARLVQACTQCSKKHENWQLMFHKFSTYVQEALRKCYVYLRVECKAYSSPLTTHDRLNLYRPARRACIAWLYNGVTTYCQITTSEISCPRDNVPKCPDHVPGYRVSMGSRHDRHGRVDS
jgi:hypothetical protein